MTNHISAPVMTCINITDFCNLKCKYCYAHNDNKIFMPTNKIIDIVTEFYSKGVWQIVLGGGEPFLHPEIIVILTQILKKGINIGVITNGTTISSKDIDSLSNLYNVYSDRLNIQVSLDGSTTETNNKLRELGEREFKTIAGSWEVSHSQMIYW